LNQSSNALSDVKLALYLADSVKPEPFLISWQVRGAVFQLAICPVWEGLAEHRWSEAQLKELQSCFEQNDFAPALQRSLHVEQAYGVYAVDLIKRIGLVDSEFAPESPPPTWSIPRVVPSGWYDEEKLQFCRLSDLQFKGAWDAGGKKTCPRRIASNLEALQASISGRVQTMIRHRLFAKALLPPLSKIPLKAAAAETAADQAAMACALERYRLARGQFPEELPDLSPMFISSLPDDPITGQPYKYRRSADGRFVLYSVGWNEKDDGGNSGPQLFDENEGDWVWSYPLEEAGAWSKK
jgi:hypothetical protein